jgi:hypothetical protein
MAAAAKTAQANPSATSNAVALQAAKP